MNTNHSLTAVFTEIPPEWNGNDTPIEVITYNVIIETNTYVIETRSNSTVSELVFNQSLGRIQFNVNGTSGTTGLCNITIPAELMSGQFLIYRDNAQLVKDVDYTETYNGTHYLFSITYEHSSHTIEITSTEIIPEFASWTIMLIILTFVAVTGILYKKKLKVMR